MISGRWQIAAVTFAGLVLAACEMGESPVTEPAGDPAPEPAAVSIEPELAEHATELCAVAVAAGLSGACSAILENGAPVISTAAGSVPVLTVSNGATITPTPATSITEAAADDATGSVSNFSAVFEGQASSHTGLCVVVSGYAEGRESDSLAIIRGAEAQVIPINLPINGAEPSERKFASPAVGAGQFGVFSIASIEPAVKVSSIHFEDCIPAPAPGDTVEGAIEN